MNSKVLSLQNVAQCNGFAAYDINGSLDVVSNSHTLTQKANELGILQVPITANPVCFFPLIPWHQSFVPSKEQFGTKSAIVNNKVAELGIAAAFAGPVICDPLGKVIYEQTFFDSSQIASLQYFVENNAKKLRLLEFSFQRERSEENKLGYRVTKIWANLEIAIANERVNEKNPFVDFYYLNLGKKAVTSNDISLDSVLALMRNNIPKFVFKFSFKETFIRKRAHELATISGQLPVTEFGDLRVMAGEKNKGTAVREIAQRLDKDLSSGYCIVNSRVDGDMAESFLSAGGTCFIVAKSILSVLSQRQVKAIKNNLDKIILIKNPETFPDHILELSDARTKYFLT
jgi:hypothetical protein